MADESIGTARIDVVVNVGDAQAKIQAVERGVAQFGSVAAEQYNKASASAKKYADSLIRQTEMMGKSRAEQIAYNAQTRIGGELGDKIAAKALANAASMSAGLKSAADSVKEFGKSLKDVSLSDTQLFKVNQALSSFKDKAEAARIEAGNLGTKLQAVTFDDTKLFRVNQALDTYRAKSLAAAEAAAALQSSQAASAAHAAAAEESARRIAQAKAQETEAVKRGEAAVASALAQQRRLEAMRADAAHAFGPLLAARERETAEMQRSNGVRDRLTAFLATERGQRIANAEAIRNQGSAYASASVMAQRSGAAATKAFAGNAKSARELQFAMRGLPAQFTDIFVSLASGQRPMMVLLQQGGQLKDMFGGVGPALRAMGSGILAMINPLTLSAAAVGALAFAWTQAENNATAFNKALLVTGGYAGKTASQMEAMVGSIAAATDATQGSAREAIQKVAETGRFTGAQFDLVSVAAARMESATGQSIDDTIKKFEELAKAPVEGLLKLNETEHFLTQAQLERVQALMAEGKEQEAAAEAARIYAGRLDEVGAAAEAARPHLSRMWKDAKEGASDAWEETKRFTEFLAAAAEKYKEMPWYKRMTFVGAIGSLRSADPAVPASVAPVAGAVDSNQARAAAKLQEDAAKFKDRYLTREQEKTRELAELDKLRAQYSEQEYQNLKKQIELKFADKTPTASRAKAPRDFRVEDMRQIEAEIAAEGKLMDQRQRGEAVVAAYKATLDDMLQTRQAQIDLQVASVGMGQHEIDQMNARIAVDKDYNRKHAELQKGLQSTSDAQAQQWYTDQLAKLDSYYTERVKMEEDGAKRAAEAQADGMNGVNKAIADFMDQQKDLAGQMGDVTTRLIGGLGDAFASFADGADAAKKSFGSLIDDMYRQALKFLANKAIQGLFDSFKTTGGGTENSTPGSTAGGWGSIIGNIVNAFTTKSANGNVFDSAGLSAYSGQIVSKPTMFAFARGAGLMGEAGPEAIMPLRRMPNGKLGVETSDSGARSSSLQHAPVTVNQTIMVQGRVDRRTSQQLAQDSARQQRIAQARNG